MPGFQIRMGFGLHVGECPHPSPALKRLASTHPPTCPPAPPAHPPICLPEPCCLVQVGPSKAPSAASTRLTPPTCPPTSTWLRAWRRPPSSLAPTSCCQVGLLVGMHGTANAAAAASVAAAAAAACSQRADCVHMAYLRSASSSERGARASLLACLPPAVRLTPSSAPPPPAAEDFVRLLSPGVQELVRQVDCVTGRLAWSAGVGQLLPAGPGMHPSPEAPSQPTIPAAAAAAAHWWREMRADVRSAAQALPA